MTEADRLSRYADVPHELAELVVMHANRANLALKCLRSNARYSWVTEVRARISIEARRRPYSFPTIGRALNLDHTSVMHLVRTRGDAA